MPFAAFISAYNEVQVATFALLNDRAAKNENRKTRHEESIGWGLTEDDKIAHALDEATAEIERICRPVLTVQPT